MSVALIGRGAEPRVPFLLSFHVPRAGGGSAVFAVIVKFESGIQLVSNRKWLYTFRFSCWELCVTI